MCDVHSEAGSCLTVQTLRLRGLWRVEIASTITYVARLPVRALAVQLLNRYLFASTTPD